jgi:hypothetical protein
VWALVRSVAVVGAAAATLAGAWSLGRGRGAVVATLGLAALWLLGRVIGPRWAHRAFRAAEYRRARVAYLVLAWLRLDPAARAAARVSAAACRVGRGDWAGAAAAAEPPAAASDAVRAVWINNRAYALVRSGGDPVAALTLADEAIALRPDLPGFRHTRGVALLAAGRLDDGIRELDEVWRRGDERAADALLEAERCVDLGHAWRRKGDEASAADYFDRARRSAPESVWATRALAELTPGVRGQAELAALLGD